ncbi:head-tail connector protein [Azospirillum agricola]|uniref:head-tail connector protein n=1 Tax=Azospirillum agricola TaxID=1720247 RepID=UPI000A0F3467|nr:head-tail connector protein [Azospirillum agricola]SMH29674.1 Phage gp6-like head-tail connector protein [Azospirillum lipoferum]SMH30576.1 Phage gp6-like head-tail connector protein [Azospirillum lipoferum]
MTVVTLDEAKAHLRVDGDADDADITLKLSAAEGAVAQHLDRPLPWQDGEGAEVPVPDPVKLAILLVLGDLYANREAAIIGATHVKNSTVAWLLDPYRRITFA